MNQVSEERGRFAVTDVINLRHLEEVSGGDKEFENELLDEYSNILCDELAKLGRFVGAGNLDEVRFVSHAIKGASASIGAEPLQAAASRMECLAREGDLPGIRATLIELERQVSRFLGWYESAERAA
jgi:HPt (histidine-containing phosphotransfer) domain-containing protein